MANQVKYLLTVDSTTGATIKIERLGDAGDLTEVPLSSLHMPPVAAEPSGVSPQSVVVNIFMGPSPSSSQPPMIRSQPEKPLAKAVWTHFPVGTGGDGDGQGGGGQGGGGQGGSGQGKP